MTFKLKDSIHKTLADSVFNELFSARSNYYYFIGKVVDWSDPTTPPTPNETGIDENDTRNRIINVKKITTSDVSLVIPRKNWATGTIYDQFDLNYSTTNPASSGATTLKSSLFYVISSSFQVYKCISNNNGAASTVEPLGNDLGVITLGDGYKWKFMYTIPLALRSRFLTDTFMPVQKSVLESFYSNGEIDAVTINSKGSGYSGAPSISLKANVHFTSPASNTTSNIPNVEAIINETTGSFDRVIITHPGFGVAGGNIVITDPTGTGSNLFPNVTFSGPGSVNRTVVNSTANLLPIINDNKFQSIAILDPGKNYTKNAQTTITVSGDGINAKLEPFVSDAGEVEDVVITNRGEGYTFAVLNVESSTGTGANVSVSFSTGDLDTSQSRVELSSIAGAIENFKVNNGGTGYANVSNVQVSVVGDGTGFTGNVGLNLGTGTVSNIIITNPGSGFTFANVIITGGGGSNANVSAILSPPNGHGFDAPTELFADSLMFFSTINNEEIHGIAVDNDFRQFGIIKDLEQSGNKKTFADKNGTPSFLATFDSIVDPSNPVAQDVVLDLKSDTTRKFVVIQTKTTTKQILLTNLNNHTLSVSDVLVTPGGREFTVSSIDGQPDINKSSGDLLFIDNRTAVTFTDDQLVTFRTILRL